MQRAERARRAASEARQACEAKLVKLIIAESRSQESLRAAQEKFAQALERRKPEAETLSQDKLASLSAFGDILVNGEKLLLSGQDSKDVVALATLHVADAAQRVAAAASDGSIA